MIRIYILWLLLSGLFFPVMRRARLSSVQAWLASRVISIPAFAIILQHVLKWTGLPWSALFFWAIFFVSLFPCYLLLRSGKKLKPLEKKAIWRMEALLFAAALFLFILFGFLYGRTAGGERPMDIGLVSRLWSTKNFPPEDFWFAKERLNTYYIGSWGAAAMGRAAFVSPWHSYFLGLVVVWAQVFAASLFIYRVWKMRGWWGAFTPFLILLTPNAAFLMSWKRGVPLTDAAFLLNFSRVIPYTINENPSIAFWISELHAHVMALPLFIMGAVFLHHAFCRRSSGAVALCGFLAAGVFMTDAWLALPFALFIIAMALRRFRNRPRFVLKSTLLLCVTSLGCAAAFLADFKGYPFRLLRVANSTTTLSHLLILFAPLLALSLAGLIDKKKRGRIYGTGLILMIASLVIIAFCELWYVDNQFPPPGERQNTIFRFHYAAGIFLSLSACALWGKGGKKKGVQRLGWIIIIFFWMCGNVIPGFARLIAEKGAWTMDVRRALDPKREGLLEASQWLFDNSPPETVIVESGGEPYRLFGTVSAMSGRTALVGEIDKVQNHGIAKSRVTQRLGKLRSIYLDRPEADDVIREFRIDYVIVSPREKKAVPDALIPSLEAKYPEVFFCEKTSILKTERDHPK